MCGDLRRYSVLPNERTALQNTPAIGHEYLITSKCHSGSLPFIFCSLSTSSIIGKEGAQWRRSMENVCPGAPLPPPGRPTEGLDARLVPGLLLLPQPVNEADVS